MAFKYKQHDKTGNDMQTCVDDMVGDDAAAIYEIRNIVSIYIYMYMYVYVYMYIFFVIRYWFVLNSISCC